MKILVWVGLWLAFPAMAFDHAHKDWNAWLKKYAVVEGPITKVNYAAAKAKPGDLEPYLKSLSAVSRDEFRGWSENQRLAFLLNAYNAFTVKLITDNYPVKSIKDLGGTFSSPWKKKFFKLFGEDKHLDNIEHDMIRKDFNEPRIHFAVVCASKGCPALPGEAITAERLDKQLQFAAESFLADKERNRYDAAANRLYLSKIFDWYGADFKKKFGSAQGFVAPIMAKGDKALEEKIRSAKVDYLDYDWTLNEIPPKA